MTLPTLIQMHSLPGPALQLTVFCTVVRFVSHNEGRKVNECIKKILQEEY